MNTRPTNQDAAQRRRTLIWVGSGVAVGAAIVLITMFLTSGGDPAIPAPAPTRTPIVASGSGAPTTPASSEIPSTSAKPVPSQVTPQVASTTAPATLGTLPAGFRLLHEGQAAQEDLSAWNPTPWAFGCSTTPNTFASFSALVASRNIQAEGPEFGASETVLVFGTDAAATQFVTEFRGANASCDGIASDNSRMRAASTAFDGSWDAGFSLSSWEESSDDGTVWTAIPGSSLNLVVRQGRAVTISSQSTAGSGDPAQGAEVVAAVRKAVDHTSPLLCSFTAKGC